MACALLPSQPAEGQRENGSRIGRGGMARRLDVPGGSEGRRAWWGDPAAGKGRLRGGPMHRTSDDRRDVRLRLGDEPRSPRSLRGACAEAPGWRRARSTPLQGERGALCGAVGMRPARGRRVHGPAERLRLNDRDVRERRDRRLRGRWRLWRALSNSRLGRTLPGRGRSGSDRHDLLRRMWIAERRLRGRDALAGPAPIGRAHQRPAVARRATSMAQRHVR